ncbi:MAG: ABC transporter permease [Betaproteobacteria bacterium]|nr:ABC transporter permease [Betaproteobacteria bacterium]
MERLLKAAFAGVVVFTLLYVTLPSVVVVVTAFNDKALLMFPPDGFSTKWFVKAWTYDDFRSGLQNGLIITAWASTIALVVGTMAAFVIERFEFRGRRLLETLLVSPLVIPHFTLGIGFLILASGVSMSRTWSVVILCHVVLVLPFVMRSVYVSLKNIDPALERAAMSLGARPLQVFLRVDLPLLLPGLAGGWLFAAILSFNEFTATLFVTGQRTQTLPVAMYTYVREYADPTMAALSTMLIAVTALALVAANRLLGLDRILSIHAGR